MLPFPQLVVYGNSTTPILSIKKFATGAANTGLLYSNGELYMGGINSNYQLGLGTNTTMNGTHNLSLTGVDTFYIHYYATIAIMNNGTIMFVGRNANFFGTGGNSTVWIDCTSYFSSIGLTTGSISDIQMGNNGIVVLDTSGNMYGIGTNQYGEFSRGNSTALTSLTLLDTSVQKISYVADSLYYLKGNNLYRAGRNTSGELGDSSTTNKNTFSVLTGTNFNGLIIDVKGGTNTCMILANPATGLRYYYTGSRAYGVQGSGVDAVAISTFTNQSSMNNKITALTTNTSGTSNYISHVYATDGIYGCGYDNGGAVGTAGVGRSGSPVRILSWTLCAGIPSTDLSTIKFFSSFDGINATFFSYNNSLYACGLSAFTGLPSNTTSFTKLTNTPY